MKTKFQAKKHAFELDCRLSELLKAAITPSNASCGTAIKGVRAVRETATAAESLAGALPDLDIRELSERFDKITGRSGTLASAINAAAVKCSFLEYATP